MKKKIFVYIGSRNNLSSLTLYLKKLLDKINTINNEIDIEVFSASDTVINHSTGCKNCFNNGVCKLDDLEGDQMKIIKEKMLTADFIIFSSPVYSHNVSGDMKAFIDRTSYWGHLFRLAGKPGMVFASGGNGLNHVLDYLEKVLLYLGVVSVNRVSVISGNPINENELLNLAETIIAYTFKEKIVKSNDTLESAFLTFRWLYSEYPKDHAEYLYWKNNGLFELSGFQELLDKINDSSKLVL